MNTLVNTIACIVVALGLLHAASAGSVLTNNCDDRRLMPNACSSVTNEVDCNLAGVPFGGYFACEWNGAACVDSDPVLDCNADILDGVNCPGTLVGACNAISDQATCITSHQSNGGCFFMEGPGCQAITSGCN